jgi:hypothetical protein
MIKMLDIEEKKNAVIKFKREASFSLTVPPTEQKFHPPNQTQGPSLNYH